MCFLQHLFGSLLPVPIQKVNIEKKQNHGELKILLLLQHTILNSMTCSSQIIECATQKYQVEVYKLVVFVKKLFGQKCLQCYQKEL